MYTYIPTSSYSLTYQWMFRLLPTWLLQVVLRWTWSACIFWGWLVLLFSLDKYPEVELLDHMVVLFLIFWGISIVAAPIYIPTNSSQGLSLLHILDDTYLFDSSHSNRCEVLSYGFVIYHFQCYSLNLSHPLLPHESTSLFSTSASLFLPYR